MSKLKTLRNGAPSRRRMLALAVAVLALMPAGSALASATATASAGSPQSLAPRSAAFESGDHREWDIYASAVPTGARVGVERGTSCRGAYSAVASIPGSSSANQFARNIWGNTSGHTGELRLGEGSDFWFSVGVYLPVGFTANMQSYYVPMRWDNYGVRNVSRSGLAMYGDGSFRLMAERDGLVGQYNLLGATTFRLSEGTWHNLEVHQRLSSWDGSALNEIYLNGQRLGVSNARNYFGEPVSAIRYGIVAISAGSQTKPLSMRFDNAYIGGSRNAVASCASPATPPLPTASPQKDTLAPTAPGALRAGTRTSSATSLSWSPATDNVAVTRYEVWRGDAAYGNWRLVGATTGREQQFLDSTAGTAAAVYAVRAFDAAQNKSPSSNTIAVSALPAVTTTTWLPDTTAPSAPTNLRVAWRTGSSVALEWKASADVVGVTRYEIWRGDAKYGNWRLVGSTSATLTTFTDSSFGISGASYGIRAFDGAGNKSASSNIVLINP